MIKKFRRNLAHKLYEACRSDLELAEFFFCYQQMFLFVTLGKLLLIIEQLRILFPDSSKFAVIFLLSVSTLSLMTHEDR